MRPKLFYTAAHAGFSNDEVPLGGGAEICERLARYWGENQRLDVTLLGPGPQSPHPGVRYVQIPALEKGEELVELSEWAYARFCRRFERAVTTYLKDHLPSNAVVLSNDVSEGPDFRTLAGWGFPILTLYHVDVVAFFNTLYLRRLLQPETLTRFYRALNRVGLTGFLPDIAGLLFEKQRDSVVYSRRLIMPSKGMADLLERCYPDVARGKVRVIPWGARSEMFANEEVHQEADQLRRRYHLQPDDVVLLCLSRISPEKGQDLLLDALLQWERKAHPLAKRLRLFICGAPAFMRGHRYLRRLQKKAASLQKIRVHFPGYVRGAQKAAFFQIASLYVFPSRHESYGLTLVEALQAGLPVLTTCHHSAKELVDDRYGRVVPAHPSALAQGLTALLANAGDLSQMKRKAQAAARRWQFSSAAEALTKLLEERGGMVQGRGEGLEMLSRNRGELASQPFVKFC